MKSKSVCSHGNCTFSRLHASALDDLQRVFLQMQRLGQCLHDSGPRPSANTRQGTCNEMLTNKLQAAVFRILPSTIALFGDVIGISKAVS